MLTDKRLKQAFDVFDIDLSGFITTDELKRVMNLKQEEDEWKRLIDEIDDNGDGEISFEEFRSLMRELLLGGSHPYVVGPIASPA